MLAAVMPSVRKVKTATAGLIKQIMANDLNAMMRQQTEPTYFTPMAVVKTMVDETDAAAVAQIQPPYEHFFRKVDMKGTFKKTWKVLGLYFTVSNCRVKKRISCGYSRKGHDGELIRRVKERLYKEHDGRCPHCGRKFGQDAMEMHHVLPYARFQDLINDERNMILLCHDCHKEIHCNPWRNIRLMEQKASELGIDLGERYTKE